MPLSARPSTKAFALLLASLGATFASGCTSFARVSAGPTLMPATKAEPVSAGVGVMAQRGFGAPTDDGRGAVGVSGGLRGNFTGRSQALALGEGFFLAHDVGRSGMLFVDGGLHFALERYDERMLVGLGPYASAFYGVDLERHDRFEPGRFFDEHRRERVILTFGPFAELDARLTRPSVAPFFGVRSVSCGGTAISPPRRRPTSSRRLPRPHPRRRPGPRSPRSRTRPRARSPSEPPRDLDVPAMAPDFLSRAFAGGIGSAPPASGRSPWMSKNPSICV